MAKGVARGNAAVVGGENYNGVFIEAEFFEVRGNEADSVVHRFHHAAIDRAGLAPDGQEACDRF